MPFPSTVAPKRTPPGLSRAVSRVNGSGETQKDGGLTPSRAVPGYQHPSLSFSAKLLASPRTTLIFGSRFP